MLPSKVNILLWRVNTVIASSPGKEVYDPWAFYLHAALLRQAFVHCGKFPTAASRRSLGRVSVPTRAPPRADPTKINLDMRDIDLDTLRCPVCDDDLESEDHIFAKCCIAVDT
ncbi:hypothetical protein Tco_1549327 [Tanacetum coccineum]